MTDNRALAKRFMALFAGLPRAHGVYDLSEATRSAKGKLEGKGATLQSDVTEELWERHLSGKIQLGIVPIRDDATAVFGAIDVDDYKVDHVALEKKILKRKFPLVMVKSKSGGAHLYFFAKKPMPAEKLRDLLTDYAAILGYAHIEIFPKQNRLASLSDTGNWINMPYCGGDASDRHALVGGVAQTIAGFFATVERVQAMPAEPEQEPGEVDFDRAVELLARHWDDGRRHLLNFAALGVMIRTAGLDPDRAQEIIDAAKSVAGDTQTHTAGAEVDRLLSQDRKVDGIPKLREYMLEDTDAFLSAVGVTHDNSITLEDFYAHLPNHDYIFRLTRAFWPASSVDARLPKAKLPGSAKKIKPSAYLDRVRPVQQIVWAPGLPEVIEHKLLNGGGWVERAGLAAYNEFRPAAEIPGDARLARQWLRWVVHLYPKDARHIVSWMAHRVQRPTEKVNHALVLGGDPGIGKDSLLEPLKYAVGPWNCKEIGPTNLFETFNPYIKAVVLRISEVHDLGDVSRFAFYERCKTLLAAPPDVLTCNDKYLRAQPVFNVVGVVMTTNHAGGIYLPANDRRHYVAWSGRADTDFGPEHFALMWSWFHSGGIGHVVAFLRAFDLSDWDAKAPPPKTDAFWAMVESNQAPESGELQDVIEAMSNPAAFSLEMLRYKVGGMKTFTDTFDGKSDLEALLTERKLRTQVPRRMAEAGYTPIRNPTNREGRWKIAGARTVIYGLKHLPERDRILAARELTSADPPPVAHQRPDM